MLHLILLSYLHVTSDLFVCLSASASLFIVVGFLLFSSSTSLSNSTNTLILFSPLFLFRFFFFLHSNLLLSFAASFVWTRVWS